MVRLISITLWVMLAAAAALGPKPAPIRPEWRAFIGEYGTEQDTVYVREEAGRLQTVQGRGAPQELKPERADEFHLALNGFRVSFLRDASGQVDAMVVDDARYPRRLLGTGAVFRIQPRRPVAELRAEAERLSPPAEEGPFRPTDLVRLTRLDPTIKLDVRYAGTDNFLSTPVYSSGQAYLQRPAASALLRAHRALQARGYGLLIHDGYRPWAITKVFWDATPVDKHNFVADPAKGSRHNRGCAVDLSLYDRRTGQPIEMTGAYDEMSERSYPTYPGGTSLQRWHRELLRQTMEAQGFTVNEYEWWHFDYRDWPRYAIGNLPFERLKEQ